MNESGKNLLADPVSSNYRKIALRPLWAAMAGSPAPPTAGPRWSSGRSRWPRAASCCLPAGRGVRRCHASPRRHRRGRCFNLAGALVGGLEVDGGARSVVGPSMPLQIVDVPRPRWPATRLHLGGLELDLRSTLTIFLPKHRQLPALDDLDCTLGLTLRARVLSPDKKQTRTTGSR